MGEPLLQLSMLDSWPLKPNSVSQPVLSQLQELLLYQLPDTSSPNVPQNLNQNLKPMLKPVMENHFFCLVLELLQLHQPPLLLDHQLAVSKLSADAEMSQSQYQELSKYQNVYQYQKHIASQQPRLFQDHQLVTMSQDKSATQSQDKFHSKYLLKNVNQSQKHSARMFHTSLPDKYARLPTMDPTNMDMDTVTESIINQSK